jgi:hypothetical protein
MGKPELRLKPGAPSAKSACEVDRLLLLSIPQDCERLNEPNKRAPRLGLIRPRDSHGQPSGESQTGWPLGDTVTALAPTPKPF